MPTPKVYKIYNINNAECVYIGSTKRELADRLRGHKDSAKYTQLASKLY